MASSHIVIATTLFKKYPTFYCVRCYEIDVNSSSTNQKKAAVSHGIFLN